MFNQINFNNEYIKVNFEKLRLHICNIEGGMFIFDTKMHHHGKFYYELHLICGGKGTLITENGSYPLNKVDIFMTGPETNYGQKRQYDRILSWF